MNWLFCICTRSHQKIGDNIYDFRTTSNYKLNEGFARFLIIVEGETEVLFQFIETSWNRL